MSTNELLLYNHYIIVGVILGLFISICLDRCKKTCMDVKCGKRDETFEMKEPITLDQELGKRVDAIEDELSIKDPYLTQASMKVFKSDSSCNSFCACKPGDTETCIDAWF